MSVACSRGMKLIWSPTVWRGCQDVHWKEYLDYGDGQARAPDLAPV
jgi:hypothetical protein